MSMNIPCINNDANEQFLQPDSQRVEFQRNSQSHWASRCPRGRNKDESSLFTKPCRIHCHGHKSCPFGWKAVAKKEYTPKKLTWNLKITCLKRKIIWTKPPFSGSSRSFSGGVSNCTQLEKAPQRRWGGSEVDPAKQRFAQLYLVDLAGSERVMKTGVQGLQLVEVCCRKWSEVGLKVQVTPWEGILCIYIYHCIYLYYNTLQYYII